VAEFSENRIYSESTPPGSGAVRLDDFLNPPPPRPSPARQAFEAEADRVARIRGLPPLHAGSAAYEIILVARLNATHPDTPSDCCAHCGRAEAPGATLLPIGAGSRHAWLHSDCWETWQAGRRAAVEKELALQGVVKP
jgi:hypothetical protein